RARESEKLLADVANPEPVDGRGPVALGVDDAEEPEGLLRVRGAAELVRVGRRDVHDVAHADVPDVAAGLRLAGAPHGDHDVLVLVLLERRVAAGLDLEVADVELGRLAALAGELAARDALVLGRRGLVRLERHVLPVEFPRDLADDLRMVARTGRRRGSFHSPDRLIL